MKHSNVKLFKNGILIGQIDMGITSEQLLTIVMTLDCNYTSYEVKE